MEDKEKNEVIPPPPSHPPEEEEENRKKKGEFYIRYFAGHRGHYGHEYVEFDIRKSGKLSYTNVSYYKKDGKIKKEVYVNEIVIQELRKIVEECGILNHSDKDWPEPNHTMGKEEVEIVMNNKHISFCTAKIGSILNVTKSKDVEGLECFYYFVQDLKSFVFTLTRLHFNVTPI